MRRIKILDDLFKLEVKCSRGDFWRTLGLLVLIMASVLMVCYLLHALYKSGGDDFSIFDIVADGLFVVSAIYMVGAIITLLIRRARDIGNSIVFGLLWIVIALSFVVAVVWPVGLAASLSVPFMRTLGPLELGLATEGFFSINDAVFGMAAGAGMLFCFLGVRKAKEPTRTIASDLKETSVR